MNRSTARAVSVNEYPAIRLNVGSRNVGSMKHSCREASPLNQRLQILPIIHQKNQTAADDFQIISFPQAANLIGKRMLLLIGFPISIDPHDPDAFANRGIRFPLAISCSRCEWKVVKCLSAIYFS